HIAVGDHRRLAQGMNLQERVRRQHGLLVAPVQHDLVWNGEFFQQPYDALRAGIIEMMDFDHWAVSPLSCMCPPPLVSLTVTGVTPTGASWRVTSKRSASRAMQRPFSP